jgi:uncharacterized protein (TIGR03000 family)
LGRHRNCCPPPCCTPAPCCGTAAAVPPPVGTTPPKTVTPPAISGKLSSVEEKQLIELKALLKGKMTPAEMKQYDEWYRGISPKERAQEYKDVMKEAPKGPAPLSKEEEKMLKALLDHFSAKDKDGKAKLSPAEIKQYEQWYREQTPAERVKEFKSEIKAKAKDEPKDKEKAKDEGKKDGAQIDAPARILVHLPADARLTIDGKATQASSATRAFQSPSLAARGVHFYELQATVERSGMQIQVNHLVRVHSGQTTEVTIEIPEVQHVLFSQR